MEEFVVDLGVSVPKELVADVCVRLTYAHAAIRRIEVMPGDDRHMRFFAESGLRRDAVPGDEERRRP